MCGVRCAVPRSCSLSSPCSSWSISISVMLLRWPGGRLGCCPFSIPTKFSLQFFLIFIPFLSSSRHRAAGPGIAGWGPGLRGGMQCRAKPEAGGELSLYSLWVRPPWPPACCTAAPETGKHHAQWLSDCFIGMFLPPPPMGRHAGRARAKTGFLPPAATPRPTASSPLFSQIASRWFDILPWQPEEANLDLARAIPPPPRARHCTCPPARPSAILEEPPGFRRQDLRRDASEQPRWLISDASEHPRAEPTRVRDFV